MDVGTHRLGRVAVAVTIGSVTAAAASGCAASPAGSGARLTGFAASSGPHPTLVVTLLESTGDEAPAVPLRRMHFFDADAAGLRRRASLDADTVIGVARGSAPVGAFEARESPDTDERAVGLVASEPWDSKTGHSGAGLASIRGGYLVVDGARVAAVTGAAVTLWERALPPIEPTCAPRDPPAIETDVLVSPGGRTICVARTVRGTAARRCDDAVADVVVLDDGGAQRGARRVRWRPGVAGPAQCAARDDGGAVVFTSSVDPSARATTAALRISPRAVERFATLRGAVLDAAPSGEHAWALLTYDAPRASFAIVADDGSIRATRGLPHAPHALVALPGAVLVASVTAPDRLDVALLGPSGDVELEQHVMVTAGAAAER